MHQSVVFHGWLPAFHCDVPYAFVWVEIGAGITCRQQQVFAYLCGNCDMGVGEQPPRAAVFHAFAADGCPHAFLVREIIDLQGVVGRQWEGGSR